MLNKTSLTTALATLTLTASLGAYAEQPIVMHVATAGPPGHVQNSVVFPTWGKWIEEATEGRVKIKLEYGLGDQSSYFTLVEDGVADATWSFHGYVPGRFRLTEMVELPNLGVNAEAASAAYWDVYQQYFADAGEHSGVELMGLFTHGPGQIFSKRPLESLADLKGQKIRLGGGIQQELGERLGVTAVSAPGPKVYELMQQGIVDGVFMPAASEKDFRLAEVAPHLTLMPGGLYLGSFAIVANEDFLDQLSDKDRQAIMDVSGARLSALAGKAWDQSDKNGLAEAEKYQVTIQQVGADDPMVSEFRQLTADLDQQWIDSVSDIDVDAQAALKAFRDAAQAYQAKQSATASR
ncbi:TRAP transporter substrate-binding protein [Marinobacterium lutimaris]|uniref:TRAP-type C4-dicarboxylate transport system, substrate-binding protein n=1 Tax=Marinobacterium lutimaris TaxID=568106 RepID=A0A1H6C129_9GAMM|nr:TRAP transporter substrate-binding protein [Marinobacterium lutimaris]SEG66674.1 TRAP-type C4-dicarboxylate transport system, substrate-binding protein [Marinobacterium lutimaris]